MPDTCLARVLVVGCPRSGTMYMAQVLNRLGLDIGHEQLGDDGSVSWREARGKPFTWKGLPVEFRHTFHQVRSPLLTIASMDTVGPPAWRYIFRTIEHVDRARGVPRLLRAMQTWYYMNRRFEERAEFTYRIEDIDRVLPEICRRLDVPFRPRALKRVPKDINRRTHSELGWAALFLTDPMLARKIMDLAEHYGYEHRAEDLHVVRGRR